MLATNHPFFALKGGLRKVAIDIKGGIVSLKDGMFQMRRDFHRRPEPGFQEVEISKVVERRLDSPPLRCRINQHLWRESIQAQR